MGRPRLYHTEEEKTNAKRRNAQRWYNKNKLEYNKGRRRARADAGAIPRKRVAAPLPVPKLRKMTKEEEQAEDIRFCLQEIDAVPQRFQEALVGKTVLAFLTELTEECIAHLRGCNGDTSRATDGVHAAGVPFTMMHLATDKYSGWLLNLVGTNHEAHERSCKMSNDLRQMGRYIDDIIARAMVEDLAGDFAAGCLDFQRGITLASLI